MGNKAKTPSARNTTSAQGDEGRGTVRPRIARHVLQKAGLDRTHDEDGAKTLVDDPDETEGRKLYRARANWIANADLAFARRKIKLCD